MKPWTNSHNSSAPRWGSWQAERPDLCARRRHASEQPPSGGSWRVAEGVWFDEWLQLKVTNGTPFAAIAARNRGMIATGNHYYLDSLRSATPPGEAKGACTNSPWFFQNGILRTAADPSGAMRRLSFALSSCTPSRTATPAKPFRGGLTRLPGGGAVEHQRD